MKFPVVCSFIPFVYWENEWVVIFTEKPFQLQFDISRPCIINESYCTQFTMHTKCTHASEWIHENFCTTFCCCYRIMCLVIERFLVFWCSSLALCARGALFFRCISIVQVDIFVSGKFKLEISRALNFFPMKYAKKKENDREENVVDFCVYMKSERSKVDRVRRKQF